MFILVVPLVAHSHLDTVHLPLAMGLAQDPEQHLLHSILQVITMGIHPVEL
jgi:hypothetical protein